jgi:hypothetical protein
MKINKLKEKTNGSKNTSNSLMTYLADSSFVSNTFLFDPDSLLFIAKIFFLIWFASKNNQTVLTIVQ